MSTSFFDQAHGIDRDQHLILTEAKLNEERASGKYSVWPK